MSLTVPGDSRGKSGKYDEFWWDIDYPSFSSQAEAGQLVESEKVILMVDWHCSEPSLI